MLGCCSFWLVSEFLLVFVAAWVMTYSPASMWAAGKTHSITNIIRRFAPSSQATTLDRTSLPGFAQSSDAGQVSHLPTCTTL